MPKAKSFWNKTKRTIKLLFKDEPDDLSNDPLIPPTFYAPRQEYEDSEISAEVIIHNHLATQDFKMNMIAQGMERIWGELGYQRGVLSILKKILLMGVGSAIGYATSHYWFPILEAVASGKGF